MLQKSPKHGPDAWGVEYPLQALADMPLRAIKPAVDAAVTWNGKWSANVSDLSENYVAFLKKRMKADVALLENATRCGRPEEAMTLCSNFALAAAHDYQNELAEVAKIWTRMVADGFAAFEAYASSAGHPAKQ